MKISIVVASGVRRHDGGQNRDGEHRVAKIREQKFRRHDAEQRQNKNHHRQLENHAQAQSTTKIRLK